MVKTWMGRSHRQKSLSINFDKIDVAVICGCAIRPVQPHNEIRYEYGNVANIFTWMPFTFWFLKGATRDRDLAWSIDSCTCMESILWTGWYRGQATAQDNVDVNRTTFDARHINHTSVTLVAGIVKCLHVLCRTLIAMYVFEKLKATQGRDTQSRDTNCYLWIWKR